MAPPHAEASLAGLADPGGEVNDLGYDDEKPWFIRRTYRRSELAELFNKVLQS